MDFCVGIVVLGENRMDRTVLMILLSGVMGASLMCVLSTVVSHYDDVTTVCYAFFGFWVCTKVSMTMCNLRMMEEFKKRWGLDEKVEARQNCY